MIKVDFHIHTVYSKDSFNSINVIKKICKKKGIFPVITDHNTIKGALKLKNCIVGEEIKTKDGEIIGLFLNEEIKKGLSIEETVEKIKEQDGLVYVPHPFDKLRSCVKRLNFKKDIFEVFNSRSLFQVFNRKAFEYAKRHNILMAVGSDAHLPIEIGKSYVIMEEFNLEEKKELLRNLKNAKFHTEKSLPFVHIVSTIAKRIRIF